MRALALALLLLSLAAAPARAESPRLILVVARGAAVTSLSRAELRRCFLGERVEAGGRYLVPFNAEPSTPLRIAFDGAVLGMTASEVGRLWVDRKVRGQSAAPRALPGPAHMLKVVAKYPGAIGYLPADQLTPAVQPVAIDGIPASDPRYLLAPR